MAISPCSVELERLHLSYPSSPLRVTSLKELLFSVARLKRPRGLIHDVHALRGVTLTITEGERLGVIGPNGAGKTTLLRAIAGVYPLADGSIRIRGTVRSLFEINLGFEIEATGRENIMYRGLLLGESPGAIRARERQIVEFADVGEFIDYPVKAYSAGMLVRLAFAVSTAFGAEILLIDEVISAGDHHFMAKARRRMADLITGARILVLVSHDLAAVRELCTRAVWLERGQIVADGSPQEVVERYVRHADGGAEG